jgi:phosphopantetheinyl transferase
VTKSRKKKEQRQRKRKQDGKSFLKCSIILRGLLSEKKGNPDTKGRISLMKYIRFFQNQRL